MKGYFIIILFILCLTYFLEVWHSYVILMYLLLVILFLFWNEFKLPFVHGHISYRSSVMLIFNGKSIVTKSRAVKPETVLVSWYKHWLKSYSEQTDVLIRNIPSQYKCPPHYRWLLTRRWRLMCCWESDKDVTHSFRKEKIF